MFRVGRLIRMREYNTAEVLALGLIVGKDN
jgi:hypothetical protein